MRPSQYHYIKRTLVHGMYNRKRAKIAKKNKKKKLKLIRKELRQREKALGKAQLKMLPKKRPSPRPVHSSAYYRNLTIIIAIGWFSIWILEVSSPTRKSTSTMDSAFLFLGWIIFLLYPSMRYLILKKKEEIFKRNKMFCPHCGSEIDRDCKFCTNCGFQIIKDFSFLSKDIALNEPPVMQPNLTKPEQKLEKEQNQEQGVKQEKEQALYNIKYRNAELRRQDAKDNLRQYDELTK